MQRGTGVLINCCNNRCEQGRLCPARRKLTERDLDRNQAAKVAASMSLPEQLLASGALEGPYRKTRPMTRWRSAKRKVVEFAHVFVLYRRHHSAIYAARRAWHIVIQGADF